MVAAALALCAAACFGLALIGVVFASRTLPSGAERSGVAAGVTLAGVVSVLTSLYPVVTAALARIVLHERLAPVQAAGVVGALAGVALITAG